jgi:hypothetical protein
MVQSQPKQIVPEDPILKKSYHKKIGLVEWLEGKALSSSPSTAKKKKLNTVIGIPFLDLYPNKMKTYIYTNVHNIIIHNSLKIETTQISTS